MLPGAHEALAAVRRQRGRVVVVTGKYPANAQRHVDHLGLDVDLLEGWVWGVGKAEVLRREGVEIYVGDHVHDVEGALAAGALSVAVLTGGCTREELEAAGHRRRARRASREFPAWLDEHLLTTRLEALERDLASAGQRAGRLQRRRGQRVPARRRGPGARPGPRRRGDRLLPLAARRPSATRRASSPSALGVELLTPRDPRDGARGLPRQRRRPLLLLQGRADRRAHPAGRGARHRHRRDRHQRRRRGRRLPARASAPPTSAARSRRCATPG